MNIPVEFLLFIKELALEPAQRLSGEDAYWAAEFPIARRDGALQTIVQAVDAALEEIE